MESLFGVSLMNFVSREDIDDWILDEKEEVLQNLFDILSPFGSIESIAIVDDGSGAAGGAQVGLTIHKQNTLHEINMN